jgi:hypothetical protein
MVGLHMVHRLADGGQLWCLPYNIGQNISFVKM